MKLTHSLAKTLFTVLTLVCATAVHAQSPTPTATPAARFTPPDEININALLPKIATAQRAAATSEFKALNIAFANNSISISTFISNQKDWSTTAVRSTTVQGAFNKNYRDRTLLVERKINLYNKYGVLAELKMPGKNVTEVLTKYRAEVAEIIARGKVFEVKKVIKVASLTGYEYTERFFASVLKNTIGVNEAFAGNAGEIQVIHTDPELGCDNQIYYEMVEYESFVEGALSSGQKILFKDLEALETFHVIDNCYVSYGVPIDEVAISAYVQFVFRFELCTRSGSTEVVSIRECGTGGSDDIIKSMFKGAASACGCSTSKPKLNPDGTTPASYPGWCAYSRYNVSQWSTTSLGSDCNWEPLI